MKDLFAERLLEIYKGFLILLPNLLLAIVFFGLGALFLQLI
jgi:hypothetical protein